MAHKWICKTFDRFSGVYFYLTNLDTQEHFHWLGKHGLDHEAIQFETFNNAYDRLKQYHDYHSDRFNSFTIVGPDNKTKLIDFDFINDLYEQKHPEADKIVSDLLRW